MDDKTWATIAIQLGVINPGLAEEFQRTKEELGLSKSLAQALKENGLINDSDIEAVSALEPVQVNGTPQNDYQRAQQEYAHKCLGAALINEEQATECLRDLVIEGQQRALRDLLIERHYATPDQLDALSKPAAAPAPAPPPEQSDDVRDLLPYLDDPPAPKPAARPKAPADDDFEAIEIDVDLTLSAPLEASLDVDSPPPPPPKAPAPVAPKAAPKPAPVAAPPPVPATPTAPIGSKKKMKCVKCRLTLEVITRSKAPNCPKCKIPLEDIGFSPQLKTDATYTTTRLKAVERPKPAPAAPTSAKPKFTCTVCDANFDAVQEPGGRLHCPSCGASFTPR